MCVSLEHFRDNVQPKRIGDEEKKWYQTHKTRHNTAEETIKKTKQQQHMKDKKKDGKNADELSGKKKL